MGLPFEIEAHNGALSFVDFSAEKEIQEEDNAASKNDVLEKKFFMDIRRLARERRLEDGTTFHQEPSKFSRAVVQGHSKGSRWKRDSEIYV